MLCCGKFVDTFIARVPRARRVGQSYLSSVVSSLAAACSCVPVLVTAQPQLLLANGPGTALPLLLLARLLAAVRLAAPCRIVFVESVCRVRTLSLTASIAQHLADECLVLWPELAAKHPKTKYIGKFL